MEVKITDYLDNDDIREIVEAEFRRSVRNMFDNENDTVRIINNLTHQAIFKEVDEIVPNYKEKINEKVIKELDTISIYHLFRKKDVWEKANSIGQDLLEESIDNNKLIIDNKVKEIFNALSKTDIKYDIRGILENYIEKLFENESEASKWFH